MFVFKMLSAVVPSITIHIFTIEEICEVTCGKGSLLEWTEQIPWPTVREWSVVVAQAHISIVLLAVGSIFVVFSMFQKVR